MDDKTEQRLVARIAAALREAQLPADQQIALSGRFTLGSDGSTKVEMFYVGKVPSEN